MRRSKNRYKNKLKLPFRYIALHKPYGYLSQFTGEEGQQTLADFSLPKGMYAVGRLDRDSEGLLLLSNDGKFSHRLLDPQFAHERTYWAQVDGVPCEEAISQLCDGLLLKGYHTKPCRAQIISPQPDIPPRDPPIRIRKSIPTTWISLTLTEGKNRQVRRMTAKVGFPTLRLIRKSIGRLQLADLKVGQWKYVSKTDIM